MSTLKVDDIQSRQSNNDAISLASDSSVSLKHSASAKLTTTATGVSVTGTCTATTFSGSGASLTSLPAANLTGTLPAIDGSALTGISSTHPAWFGTQTSSQSGIASHTWTTITGLTNELVDPSVNNTGWDYQNGIFTVQSGQAGIYYAFGQAGIDDIQSDDVVRCGISKNNVDPIVYGERRAQYQESNGIYAAAGAQVFSLAVGDTLRLKVWHDEGSWESGEWAITWFGGFRIFAT